MCFFENNKMHKFFLKWGWGNVGSVPSEVFLEVRQNDDFVVGIIDFRHPLSDFPEKFGGHIGYSIRPSERRKGYASEMLRLVLPLCREIGESKILLTCDKGNVASQKTIIKKRRCIGKRNCRYSSIR